MQYLLTVFKALSEETRLRIVKLLEKEELCVCDLVAALDTSQPKISFHLNALKEAGLVKDRKQGRWVHYSIDGADTFKRFLMLSVFERIAADDIAEDQERLKKFFKSKSDMPSNGLNLSNK